MTLAGVTHTQDVKVISSSHASFEAAFSKNSLQYCRVKGVIQPESFEHQGVGSLDCDFVRFEKHE